MAGFRVIANEEEHVGGRIGRESSRYENGELLPVGKYVPIGSEIQNEPHSYERRPNNRQDGDELRGRGFFGFQTVMREQPFGL